MIIRDSMVKKRFRLDLDEKIVIDDLTGIEYPVHEHNSSLKFFCELLNVESERADRNAKIAFDKEFNNPYQLWCSCSELCGDLQEQIEHNIRRYIKYNWDNVLEAYVEFHPYGCIEITVYDKTLNVKLFEQKIIGQLLEMYTLKINGFETYMTDEDENCYYEWHLGKQDENS